MRGPIGDSMSGHQIGSGPIVTTVTTITHLNPMMPLRSTTSYGSGSEKKVFEGVGLRNILSEHEINLIKNSWNTLKKRGDFAPKVFVRLVDKFC